MIFLLLVLQDPADELRDVVRALREERAAAYARRRTRGAEIEAARAPIRRLEGEVAELKLKETDAAKEFTEVTLEIQKLQQDQAASEEPLTRLAPELESTSAFLKDFVLKGIPYRQADRLARLGEGGTPAERVGRVWAFAQEELRIARSGEAWTADVQLSGGRVKPARLFRTGHLLCGFVTEDGLETGLWQDGWHDGHGAAVRQAVEMLDRRRPPGLLLFPVEKKAAP